MFCQSFFSHSPFPSAFNVIIENSNVDVVETAHVGLTIPQCNDAVVPSYRKGLALLVSDLRNGVDGWISTKVDALEADPFEQCVYIRRSESWTN